MSGHCSEALATIEAAARRRAGRPLYAPNWDEQDWPERRPPKAQELDRATYGGVVYSPRVDGHSAVISSALAAASGARNHPGWNDSGLVTREAHHAARDAFNAGISPADRRADIDAALSAAAAAGIGLVHENGGPTLSSEADFADVLAAGERGDGPQVIGYWAELVGDEESARALASRMGARGLAGDLNIDGSIGSRTASLREPYVDGPDPGHRGNPYLSVEQVRDHVAACSLAGIQAGFHVIGDAGADTVIAGFQAAASPGRRGQGRRGTPPPGAPRDGGRRRHQGAGRARRHRLGPAGVRRPLGRARRHVCRPAGSRPRHRYEPVRHHGRRRHVPRLRLGHPGDAVRAVGGDPRPASTTTTRPSGSRRSRRSWRTPAAGGAPPASTTAATSRWASRQALRSGP